MLLDGNQIVITGAGRGIGRTVALRCAREGATLALLARTEHELQETCRGVRKHSPRSFYLIHDVSDLNSVRNAKKHIIQKFSRIDGLVNNAGIQPPIGPLHQIDPIEWKHNIEVNLFGAMYWTHVVLEEMVLQRRGKIVNLAGGGATSPRLNFSAYAVAKVGVVRLAETIAQELKHYNIDVNAVSPGAINTKMLSEILAAKDLAGNEFDSAVKQEAAGGQDPERAADLVCFLLSDQSNGITGKLISAQWDPWDEEEFQYKLRNDAHFATLRRIDEKHFDSKR